MANQHLTSPPTELLRARLKVLLENTNSLYQNGENVLEEDLVTAYHEALEIFMKSLDSSVIAAAAKIQMGYPADPLMYNVFTNSMLRDMEALFSEIGALDRLVVSSFNSVMSERDQVMQTSRRISNKLGDYLLYADPSLGAGYFFGDSFNSPERVDVGSGLVDGDECFLGQNEGVVLLPLDGNPDRPNVKSYIVNAPSNGTPGNNSELDVIGKDDLAAIGDNEPNTWFEYEKVSAYESNEPLVFDLTIALEEISVINHVHINPINFGTYTPVKIMAIETSKDGQEYRSILDDVPIKDFVPEDENKEFELSPATSKFAGEGFWSFLPRKAQYIHIVLQQETPYIINTVNGERRRYAIGIRDINVLGRKFKEEGSLISTQFTSEKDIRKVSLWASENPTEASELADLTHYISENDGATWRPIQPQGRDGNQAPEVINYNNIADDSISTDTEVKSFRHKISMKREKDAFQGEAVVKRERINQSDLVAISGGEEELTLTQKPIKETVRIVLPFYGSFSCPNSRSGEGVVGKSAPMDLDFLEFNVDQSPVDKLRFQLPFKDIPNLKEHIRVMVNGEQIEFCEKENVDSARDTSYYPDGIDKNSKVYFLNKGGRELQFGHTIPGDVDSETGSLTQYGFIPPGGANIQVCMDGDNPRLELTDQGYVLNLSLPSDGFKENISIVSIDALSMDESILKTFGCSAGQDRFKVPVDLVGARIPLPGTEGASDGIEETLDRGVELEPKEAEEGLVIPVINPDINQWTIQEYLFGEPYEPAYFTDKVEYINGSTEFYDGGVKQENRYSFNPVTGMLYLASRCPHQVAVLFKYNVLKYTTVPSDGWKFYSSTISNKVNTAKIILDPKYVKTLKRLYVKEDSDPITGVDLIGENVDSSGVNLQTLEHGWNKQRLVKGTVKIKDMFPAGSSPVEVPFIDGRTELSTQKVVTDEPVQAALNIAGLYQFTLQEISSLNVLESAPGFAAVRSTTSATTPVSQLNVDGLIDTNDPSTLADNQWCYVVATDGTCDVFLKLPAGTEFNEHVTEYTYTVQDPGVDINGLYSVDYENGIIYFAQEITGTGEIEYEVSTYSAFYNVADVISDSDIREIDEPGKTVSLSPSFVMRMLKLSSPLKARPSYARVVYDYYKESTESLKDLEKYFSPICKDLAFRAVSSDVLEEL